MIDGMPETEDRLLALLNQISTTLERQAEALERIAARLESGESYATTVADIEQPAIESLTLALRDTR